jgi:hypothetical protein
MRVIKGEAASSEVILELEKLLEDAKSGRVTGIACLVNYRNTCGFYQAGQWSLSDALFAFECWKKMEL